MVLSRFACICRGRSDKANPHKEAVPIDGQDPKKQRSISTESAKTDEAGAAAPKKKKKRKRRRFSIIRFFFSLIGCIICLCIMAVSVGAVLLSMYVVQVTAGDEEVLDLDSLKLAQTSIIYDINGDEYATLTGDDNRIWRSLSDIPQHLQDAVIAVEDKDFYQETLGINLKRTVAAALNKFTHNALLGSQQGASTIEQQLIKNLTGDKETDYMRKVREIFRAMGVARRYSKETVLEAYLNIISLTGQIHGMEVAANEYFGKHVEELTLAESATLASITKNPTNYNPYTNPENLVIRRNHVLGLMRDQGRITAEECSAAQAEPLTMAETNSTNENVTRTSRNSWFTDALYESLLTTIMEERGLSQIEAQAEIFSGGLRIQSTVDPDLQAAVERVMLDEAGNFPPLWHEEEVETSLPADAEITYGEDGMPLDADGTPVFQENDIPVYTDSEETTFKTGTNPDDQTMLFYEQVRTQVAIAVLDYDGNILAIGGGVGEKQYDRGTNRATIPHQTGSTMKPIAAYCRALDSRLIHYSKMMSDTPFYSADQKMVLNTDLTSRLGLPNDRFSPVNLARNDVWKSWPENYGGAGGKGDNMLIYDALRRSYNTVAVWVGDMVGAEDLFNFAHDTLQCSYLDPEHDVDLAPMVLGSQTYGLTVVELAGAYSIFYDGTFTTPHYFTEVYDYLDNMYLDNTKRITTTQAIRPDTASIMNRLLYRVLHDSAGTAYGMAPDPDLCNGMDAVAKTGTTSDYKDYTFAGLTPYYVTGMWWGFDKPHDMYSLGGRNGQPIQRAWKALMEEVQGDLEFRAFPMADNVVERKFDPGSGVVTGYGETGYYTEDNMGSNSDPVDDYAYVDPLTQAEIDAGGQPVVGDPAVGAPAPEPAPAPDPAPAGEGGISIG